MIPKLAFSALALSSMLLAQSGPGPAVGEPVPEFQLVDHQGRSRNLANLAGEHGLLLLVSRSADW